MAAQGEAISYDEACDYLAEKDARRDKDREISFADAGLDSTDIVRTQPSRSGTEMAAVDGVALMQQKQAIAMLGIPSNHPRLL